MGVLDEYGILDENEIFCAVEDFFGQVTIVTGQVVLLKRKNLNPEDVKVM